MPSEKASLTARLLGALVDVHAVGAAGVAGVQLPEADAPVVHDLGNGLAATYVIDEGDHFTYVQNRELKGSDFIVEGLHESSISNLARRCEGKAKVQQHGAIHGVFFDGRFEASLMLVDALWEVHLARLAPNGFVAALPARDVFAFCDANSQQGIAELREVVRRVTESGSDLITPQLYTRKEYGWVPYQAG